MYLSKATLEISDIGVGWDKFLRGCVGSIDGVPFTNILVIIPLTPNYRPRRIPRTMDLILILLQPN